MAMLSWSRGGLVSELLARYYDEVEQRHCDEKPESAREECQLKAEAAIKDQGPKCEDVVWHMSVFGRIDPRDKSTRPVGSTGEAVEEQFGTDDVVYAWPTLTDAKRFMGVSSLQSEVVALCVDPDKAIVTEDIDNRSHPMFNGKGRKAYYKSKMVTLREYRDKGLSYQIPEVLLPQESYMVLGILDLLTKLPHRCVCDRRAS